MDIPHLVGNANALGTLGEAGVALRAEGGVGAFGQGRIALEEFLAVLLVVFGFLIGGIGQLEFVAQRVVNAEDAGDVDTVRARHAIAARGARDVRVAVVEPRHFHQVVVVLGAEGLEVAEGVDVLHQLLHIAHTAEGAHHGRIARGEGERHAGRGKLREAGGQFALQAARDVGQGTAADRLHDDHGNVLGFQHLVERFGIAGLVAVFQRHVLPVHIVHLDLDEFPVIRHVEKRLEGGVGTVEREAQVPDRPLLAEILQVRQQAVVHEALLEIVHAADRVEQEVVHIVGAQVLQGIGEHRLAGTQFGVHEIRHLGRDQIVLAVVAAEGLARRPFGIAVGRRRVEIVDAVLERVVDHLVDGFLVERGAAAAALAGEAHAAHAQQADALAAQRLPGAVDDLVAFGGFGEFPVSGHQTRSAKGCAYERSACGKARTREHHRTDRLAAGHKVLFIHNKY